MGAEALEAGKSVVTANKKLIAAHGVELEALARSRGCQLLYGAAVAGGVPVIPGCSRVWRATTVIALKEF